MVKGTLMAIGFLVSACGIEGGSYTQEDPTKAEKESLRARGAAGLTINCADSE
jgi:hypothetical protein